MATEQTSRVAFEADISQFSQSIAEMRSDIKLINSQFEASSSSMDDWSKTSEGLETKIKQLTDVLEAEKQKLKANQGIRDEYISTLNKNKAKLAELKSQYDQVVASEGENSNSAKKLAKDIAKVETAITKNAKSVKYYETEMNRQQATVNKTEKELKEYKTALEQVGNETEETAKKTKDATDSVGGFGGAIKGIGKGLAAGIVAIGAAAAGAATSFLALAESTREYRTDLAKLNTNAQTAGVAQETVTKALRDLNAITGETDSNVEALSNLLMANFTESNMANAVETLSDAVLKFPDTLKVEGLADSLQESMQQMAMGNNATGQYAELLERLGYNLDTVKEQYNSLGSEEEKQAYLLDLVNKKIGGTSDAYREQNKDLVDAANAQFDLNESLSNLGAVAEPIVSILKSGLAKVLEQLTPLITQVAEAFEKMLGGDVKGGIESLGDIFLGLKEKANETFLGVLDGITSALPQVLPKVVEFLSSMIQQFISFAPQLTEASTELFMAIVDSIGPVLTSIIEQLPSIISNLTSALSEMLPMILETVNELVSTLLNDVIPSLIDSLVENLPMILETLTSFIQESIPVLMENFQNLLGTLVEAIPDLIQKLADSLPTIIGAIVSFIADNLPTVLNAANDMFNQVIAAIPVLLVNLAQKLPTIISKIVGTLLANAPKIAGMAFDLFMNIVSAIPKLVIELGKNLPTIIKAILDGFKNAPTMLKTVGEDIIKGLWDGIKGLKDWLQKKLESAADWLPKWVKEKLGIASPSKVFKEIGKFSADGLGIGFTDEMKKVKNSIVNAVDMDGLGIDSNVSLNGSGNGNGNNNFGGSKVVHLNYTVNSPKQLSRRELYTQAKKMQTILGGVN